MQGFENVKIIYNAFQVDKMLRQVKNQKGQMFLKKNCLIPNRYIYIGTYHHAKGQMLTVKKLFKLGFTLVATSTDQNIKNNNEHLKLIHASFTEYNYLLKNARLAIAMSTFKEGWCRVLHEAAIHGTPILGSGLGGMRELLQLSSVRPSTFNTLNRDVMKKLMEPKLSDDIQKNFAGFTSKKFKTKWFEVVSKYLNEQ